MQKRRRSLSHLDLTRVQGGMRYGTADRLSSMIDDRRNEAPWTPTEDGRLVGPQGQWTWDQPNQSQPGVTYTPTEDGHLWGSDNRLYQDDSINGTIRQQELERQLPGSPGYDELGRYSGDALRGPMTPTEDGYLVGPSGRVYDDPTINQGLQNPEPGAGDFVPRTDDYEPPGGSFFPTNDSSTTNEATQEQPSFDTSGDETSYE